MGNAVERSSLNCLKILNAPKPPLALNSDRPRRPTLAAMKLKLLRLLSGLALLAGGIAGLDLTALTSIFPQA